MAVPTKMSVRTSRRLSRYYGQDSREEMNPAADLMR